MKILDFEKTAEGRWYVVLPEWPGEKSDLEMVWGADMMLDLYAQGSNKLTLSISETEVPGYDKIQLVEICSTVEGGAYYKIDKINNIDYNFKAWICDVTKFLYGEFPPVLFLQNATL